MCQGCEFEPQSGHIRESCNECVNKRKSQSLFLSFSLSLKSINKKICFKLRKINYLLGSWYRVFFFFFTLLTNWGNFKIHKDSLERQRSSSYLTELLRAFRHVALATSILLLSHPCLLAAMLYTW